MLSWIRRYAEWLHLGWPAGTVEPLPQIGPDGTARWREILVTGDLTGIPLLKFALDTGARAAQRVAADPALPAERRQDPDRLDLLIIGGGVSGFAAAMEARQRGLSCHILEAAEPLSTLANFPRGKPIFTYPSEMRPAGALQVTADVKEALLDELRRQIHRAGVTASPGRVVRLERRCDGAQPCSSTSSPSGVFAHWSTPSHTPSLSASWWHPYSSIVHPAGVLTHRSMRSNTPSRSMSTAGQR